MGYTSFRPELTAPADLAAFWERTYEEATHKLTYTRERVEAPFTQAIVYRIVLEGAGGTPIHTWLMLPNAEATPQQGSLCRHVPRLTQDLKVSPKIMPLGCLWGTRYLLLMYVGKVAIVETRCRWSTG